MTLRARVHITVVAPLTLKPTTFGNDEVTALVQNVARSVIANVIESDDDTLEYIPPSVKLHSSINVNSTHWSALVSADYLLRPSDNHAIGM
jgi:hypothetical protein